MNNIVDRLEKIKSNFKKTENTDKVKIIAVSKTFDLNYIMPLVDNGHVHFGVDHVCPGMISLPLRNLWFSIGFW